MTFQEALDFLKQTHPPPEVALQQEQKGEWRLFFGHQQGRYKGASPFFFIVFMLLGVYFLVAGMMILLTTVEDWWRGVLFMIIGLGMWFWAGRGLRKSEQEVGKVSNYTQGNVLELHLHEQGGELYKHEAYKEGKIMAQFTWEEITKVLLGRRKYSPQDTPPYFIKISSNTYEDLYLLEWELLGEEVSYLGNVIRALKEHYHTGGIPEDWNKSIEDQDPPLLDLSDHLIDD